MATIGVIKKVQLAAGEYTLDATKLLTEDGVEKSWEDIVGLLGKKLQIVVPADGKLPTASAETMNKLYLIPAEESKDKNIKDEYITIDNGASASPRYAWEKIGSTAVDLTNYVQYGTYTDAAASAGAHTHTVSGKVTVPTVTKTGEKLSANVTRGTVTAPTSRVISGFGAHSTDAVLGQGTQFTVSGGTATSGTVKEVATNTEVTIPNVTANADAVATKTVFGTATEASKVAVTAGQAASFTGATAAAFTQGSKASFTQGSKADWSAAVDSYGVLSFSFTANGDDTFVTNGDDSFTPNAVGTFTPNTPTTVTATPVSVPVVSSNAEVTASKVTLGTALKASKVTTNDASVVTDVSAISVAADESDIVNPITGLGTATQIDAVTSVDVAAPGVTLVSGASGDVSYIKEVTVGTTQASITDGSAASAGEHAHDDVLAKE